MTTIDEIFLAFIPALYVNYTSMFSRSHTNITLLKRQLQSTEYITPYQSKQILSTLQKCKSDVSEYLHFDISPLLDKPVWKRPFTTDVHTKSVYLDTTFKVGYESGITSIVIFCYPSNNNVRILRKKLHMLIGTHDTGKTHIMNFSEQNIVRVVEILSKYKFQISTEILEIYNTIKLFYYDECYQKYHINNNPLIYDMIKTELDHIPEHFNLVDKRIKYQYFVDDITDDTLFGKIVNRTTADVFINTSTNLSEIFENLYKLDRKKIVIYFDKEHCIEQLLEVHRVIQQFDIQHVGVYSRLDNEYPGKQFNDIVHENQYNCFFNDDIELVCFNCNKFPKFILNSTWEPDAIISFVSFTRRAPREYAQKCDLVIQYIDNEQLIKFNYATIFGKTNDNKVNY